MPRARDAGGPQHLLHPRLVPHVVGGGDVHAGDAEHLAGLGERDLELLERADDPVDLAELAGAGHAPPRRSAAGPARCPPASAPRACCAGAAAPSPAGRGHQAEPDPGDLGGEGDEARGGLEEVGRDERDGNHAPGRYRPRTARRLDGTEVAGCESSSSNPRFPNNQRQFVRGLAEVGAEVIGLGERPQDWLDDELRSWMVHYHQVGNVTDVGADDRRGALAAGQALDRPPRGDDRVAHAGRGAGAGELRDPRHLGAHDVAVPRQAVDEGGAAPGRRPDRGVDRRRQRRTGVGLRRRGRLSR